MSVNLGRTYFSLEAIHWPLLPWCSVDFKDGSNDPSA